eukprot:g1638.t1
MTLPDGCKTALPAAGGWLPGSAEFEESTRNALSRAGYFSGGAAAELLLTRRVALDEDATAQLTGVVSAPPLVFHAGQLLRAGAPFARANFSAAFGTQRVTQWLPGPGVGASFSNLDEDDAAAGQRPIVVLQRPGELLLLPHLWWHATMNVHESMGLGAQLPSESVPEALLAHARPEAAPRCFDTTSSMLLAMAQHGMAARAVAKLADTQRELAGSVAEKVLSGRDAARVLVRLAAMLFQGWDQRGGAQAANLGASETRTLRGLPSAIRAFDAAHATPPWLEAELRGL